MPAELARRETRLAALAEARATLEAHARERFAAEQQTFEERQSRRKAQRKAGKDPQPPSAGPRDKDQVNLTDEESRILPVSGGGFDQCFNAQAGVDTETMLVLGTHVSQAPNDKQQLAPAKLMVLPADLGQATDLLADTGYFSRTNVEACRQQGIEPWLAQKRETHHGLPTFLDARSGKGQWRMYVGDSGVERETDEYPKDEVKRALLGD